MKVVSLGQAGVAVDLLDKAMREAAIRGLRSAAARGVQVIVTQIIPSRTPQPVDRSVYRAGWRAVASMGSEGGGRWNAADIYNAEPHAAHIEYGVRAANVKIGRVMIQALTAWVQRKGIAKGAEAVGAAWAIAKAMQKRGIFGRGLGILTELVEKRLPTIIKEEVERELAQVEL